MNITKFKNELKYGGARTSLFEVSLNFPVGLVPDANSGIGLAAGNQFAAARKINFMCKAASIPQSSVSAIDVSYFGRKVKVAGARTFEPWTITIINDEDFLIRKTFESWLAAINGHESNTVNSGITSRPETYQTQAFVSQFSKGPDTKNPLRTYKFNNVFPSDISAIEVGWENENTIEEFTVTLQYDYWTVDSTDIVPPI